ncbi:MAG: hypothetical protein J6I64_02120 [Lachnospiraceae bacterium]|nr:hypothetical protein [Lachnospiraceae bacterium]
MKKTVVGVMITAVLLSLGAVQSVAAEKTESWDGGQCAESQCFVDENSDGVCDLSEGSCVYLDADGDGICDSYNGNGRGHGCGNDRGGSSSHGCRRGCGRRTKETQ